MIRRMFPRSIGAVLLIVGGVFLVQGFGLIATGSAMDGNPFWGVVGLISAIAGLAVILVRRRS